MIIDAHAHYTTAPPELQAYRGRQIMNLRNPARPRLQVSDEQLERSMRNQFKRMQDSGIDRLLFSPQASAMGHHFGSELVSRYWTEACNDLIARIARLFPDKVSPVCQLPQSPGVSPKTWVEELERCVKEQGFVACNINPDVAGGGEPFTPSLGDEWWYPLWEKMVELDIPGTIHASASLNPAHAHDHFLLHRPASLWRGGTPQLARLPGLPHLEADHSAWWRGHPVPMEPASRHACAGGP